jgi:hypothetical protein
LKEPADVTGAYGINLRANQKNGLNAGYASRPSLFLDAAGRLWHPLLRHHIPLPCAVQFCSLS